MKRHRTGWNLTRPAKEEASSADTMDWEPTPQVAAGKPSNRGRTGADKPRAKWVSQDVLDQRRDDQLCLRCGGDSHFIDKCQYAPARRPNSSRPERRAAVAASSSYPITEKAPAKDRTATGKAKTKKTQPLARVEEVQDESGWSSASDSENE